MTNVVNLEQRPDMGKFLSQLFISVGIVLVSTFILSVLGLFIGAQYAGVDISSFQTRDFSGLTPGTINGFKIIQFFYQVGSFLLPAIILPLLLFRASIWQFAGLKRNAPFYLFILAIIIFYLLTPLLNLSISLNREHLWLPEGLNWLEKWMQKSEDQAGELTNAFLAMPTLGSFLINVLLIALLPAIGEELFFRGFAQRLFYHWWGRRHLAVFAAAFLFSFIHFQFYGFLPRLLLGMLLGYIYLWSRDLKVSIFVHFLNNFTALAYSYYSQQQGGTVMPEENADYPVYIYLLSAAAGAATLYLFYRNCNRRKERSEYAINIKDMEKDNWVKVHVTGDEYKAEIIAGNLKSEGIQAVILNKKDSSYLSFGDVEIYVHHEDRERAMELIPSYQV